jgi:hypothetical protein
MHHTRRTARRAWERPHLCASSTAPFLSSKSTVIEMRLAPVRDDAAAICALVETITAKCIKKIGRDSRQVWQSAVSVQWTVADQATTFHQHITTTSSAYLTTLPPKE